jgi:hypothetical protein
MKTSPDVRATCRKFTGGIWVGTCARQEHIIIERGDTLKWYRSSAEAQTTGVSTPALQSSRDHRV